MNARQPPLNVAVIGSGISGLAAAWLLAPYHRVTLFEAAARPGGHANTVEVETPLGTVAVDTGFIVYNQPTYPNLTALLAHLDVPTKSSSMSFAVSLDDGALEYAGSARGLLAQPRNLARPRYWSMLRDLLRFYRDAPGDIARGGFATLGDYLDSAGYGAAFRDDHLLPMAAAIWSMPADQVAAYPAAAFIRFCDNHGLLKLRGRPQWRTVAGGSQAYVERMLQPLAGRVRLNTPVRQVQHIPGGNLVVAGNGRAERFDEVVIAAHADQALAMLADPTPEERRLLGAFRYAPSRAVLHRDPALMPRRRRAWASWNYLGWRDDPAHLSVTYWMNRLQGIAPRTPLFVTLNPARPPRDGTIVAETTYAHPQFDGAALAAQKALWSLQGRDGLWFCGAWFGSGFHEDGLQAGLAVAETLGGVRRPWSVPNESGRIAVGPVAPRTPILERAS